MALEHRKSSGRLREARTARIQENIGAIRIPQLRGLFGKCGCGMLWIETSMFKTTCGRNNKGKDVDSLRLLFQCSGHNADSTVAPVSVHIFEMPAADLQQLSALQHLLIYGRYFGFRCQIQFLLIHEELGKDVLAGT
jgi:hypothetical protein